MNSRYYIPFTDSFKTDAIVVDAITNRGMALSHWKGAPVPEGCEHDTSAGIAIHAIKKQVPGTELLQVTANHFDVDGFIGVWSLLNPALALEHEALLKEVAIIGDFREYDPAFEQAEKALALTCWLNSEEKRLFYRPFGSEDEMKDCDAKFRYFLPAFADVLLHTEKYHHQYAEETARVLADYQLLGSVPQPVLTFPDIGLAVVYAPAPMHYYALFSRTHGFDKVLSIYPEQRYELEYKYTTWVNTWSHPVFPRITPDILCKRLNQAETSGYQWHTDKITDTGPILRMENTDLSKAERFAHPYERPVHTSSIPEDHMIRLVSDFFRESYRDIRPATNWSWEETRRINAMLLKKQEIQGM